MIEHVNEAACRDLGFRREELVGNTLGQLFSGYPRSQAFHWERQIVEQGKADSREELSYEGVLDNRRWLRRAYDVRAAPLGGGRLVLTWRDVTSHARKEQQLRLQAQRSAARRRACCLCGHRTERSSTRIRASPPSWAMRLASSTGVRWRRSTGRTSSAGRRRGAVRSWRGWTRGGGELRGPQQAQGRHRDLVRSARCRVRRSGPRQALGGGPAGRDRPQGGGGGPARHRRGDGRRRPDSMGQRGEDRREPVASLVLSRIRGALGLLGSWSRRGTGSAPRRLARPGPHGPQTRPVAH